MAWSGGCHRVGHWWSAEVNPGSNQAVAMGLIGSEASPPGAPARTRAPCKDCASARSVLRESSSRLRLLVYGRTMAALAADIRQGKLQYESWQGFRKHLLDTCFWKATLFSQSIALLSASQEGTPWVGPMSFYLCQSLDVWSHCEGTPLPTAEELFTTGQRILSEAKTETTKQQHKNPFLNHNSGLECNFWEYTSPFLEWLRLSLWSCYLYVLRTLWKSLFQEMN